VDFERTRAIPYTRRTLTQLKGFAVANTWWYALDNQKQGPVEIRELERLLRANTISGKTLVWQAPMPQWIPLERVPQLRSIVPTAAMSASAVESEPPVAAPPAAPRPSAAPPAAPVAAAAPYAPPAARVSLPASSDDRSTYGGFWRRAAALMLDGLILGVPMWIILGAIMGAMGVFSGGGSPDTLAFILGGGLLIVQLGFILIYWFYNAKLESGPKQATIGKRLVGLYVETADTSQRVGFGRATGRFFAKSFLSGIAGIGYLMVAFTGRRQGLHDFVATTVVRRRAGVSGTGWMVVGLGTFFVFPLIGIVAAVAIPAYADYNARAKVATAQAYAQQAARSVGEYAISNEALPESLEQAGFNVTQPDTVSNVSYDASSGGVEVYLNAAPAFGSLTVTPLQGDNGLELQCDASGLPERYRPSGCQ
jgi:uncharacterized RDD family membrane protein YckC/Tfp pilus assembly major pilin PilA